VSIKRIAALVVVLVVIGAAAFFFHATRGSAAAPQAAAPGGSTATGTDGATSAVQLELVRGTAKANNVAAETGDLYSGPSDSPIAMKWVQLSAGAAGPLNPVVVNGAGRTVYRFDKDTANPPRSTCDGDCAKTWPPVLVQAGSRVFVDGVSSADVGTVTRSDGATQVTLKGWPVYLYSKDTKPGDVNGQGVGNVWYAITPDGQKAGQSAQGADVLTGLEYRNGTAQQNNAPPNTGDFYKGPSNNPAAMKWVQLTAGSAGGLSPIVHNGVGLTLYRFDKDTAKPPKSTCNDQCAVTWQPVLVQHGSRIFVDGVSTAQVGIVTRADGSRQVTLGGWPLYKYSKDANSGDINGESVGGVWFAASPRGEKVQQPAG
jgi:predicted lipoprotein with Yx(FWY)xxD motif